MDYAKTKAYKDTKADLLMRLGDGATGSNLSLIDTYMRCWVEARMLEDDVTERGMYVEYQNSTGGISVKKNESVGEKLKVVTLMLKIRDALGVTHESGRCEEDEM